MIAHTLGYLVALFCVALAYVAYKNARHCLLNQHEHVYAVALSIAAVTIVVLLK
jgi:hypothetical protein